MLTSEQQTHKSKQSKIRYTEYYDLQSTFDRLYADSLKGKTFQPNGKRGKYQAGISDNQGKQRKRYSRRGQEDD